MNKILIILFILTSSVGFSKELYLEPIDKHDSLVVQTIDDKIYINPNCIFYEDNTMLLQTDDNRYLPVVYFEKDNIGYYTLKAEKILEIIGFNKKMIKKLKVFNATEYRNDFEIASVEENPLCQRNASVYFAVYNESKKPSEEVILCGEMKSQIKIEGSDKDGKKEFEGSAKAEYKDTTKKGTEYKISTDAKFKIDEKGKTEKKIEFTLEMSA